jgi:Zinc-binding dehydrogenase
VARDSTNVRFAKCVVNRENLEALARVLEAGNVKVVIDKVYPLREAANAVSHMLGHHARGKVVIAVQGRALFGSDGDRGWDRIGGRQAERGGLSGHESYAYE